MLKNDKLDALILLSGSVLISKNADLYKNAAIPLVKRPRSLDAKVQRSINKERRRTFGTFFQYGQRVAAAVLVACTLSFAAVMSVEAVRTTLWNTIVRFFEDCLSVSYVTETQPPKQLEDIKEPSCSEQGWEKQVVLETASMRCVIYRKNGTKLLTYTQEILDGEAWFDNEDTEIEPITIGDRPAMLMFRNNQKTYSLSWSDGAYAYTLDAHVPELTKEDLIHMAETIE